MNPESKSNEVTAVLKEQQMPENTVVVGMALNQGSQEAPKHAAEQADKANDAV